MKLFDVQRNTYLINSEATKDNHFVSFHDAWIERGIVATSSHVPPWSERSSISYKEHYSHRDKLRNLPEGSIVILWVSLKAKGKGPKGLVAIGTFADDGSITTAHSVETGKISLYAHEEFQRKVNWNFDLRSRPIAYCEVRSIIGSHRDPISPIPPEQKGRLIRQPFLNFLEQRVKSDQSEADYESIQKDLEQIDADPGLTDTQKKVLKDARIGQGKYRDALLRLWDRQCAITGSGLLPILRASHAKAWRHASNVERLDPNNGLLLTATLDALFDRHLICFDDTGQMHTSPMLSSVDLELFRLPQSLRKPLNDQQRKYLEYHRQKTAWY
jgi:hypothetical protein